MKNYVVQADWEVIEEALMKAEIPFRVSFDSHITDDMEKVVYDKYIHIEPFIIQKEIKV